MTTITQVKFILKQLLLLSVFVYLLSGRSIPGVTESTPVQFNLSGQVPFLSASDLVGELAPPKEGSKIDSVFRAALYVTALAKFGDPPLIIQPDALPTHDVYTRAGPVSS